MKLQPPYAIGRRVLTPVERWHYAFGLHSNIPACCIEYWLTHEPPFLHDPWAHAPENPNHPQYVRCMGCAIENRVNLLHICDEPCAVKWLKRRKDAWTQQHDLVERAFKSMEGKRLQGQWRPATPVGYYDPEELDGRHERPENRVLPSCASSQGKKVA